MSVFVTAITQLISKMPKPKEVYIVIDEDGLPREETMVNTEKSSLYPTMREIFRKFAVINWNALEHTLKFKMGMMVNTSEFSYSSINSLCWTSGCFARILPLSTEKNFFVHILRTLLELVKQKNDLDDKIVIASNIMHIVCEYENFFRDSPAFLAIVIKKTFDFIKEKNPGVKKMACNTLLKLIKNSKKFLRVNSDAELKGSLLE